MHIPTARLMAAALIAAAAAAGCHSDNGSAPTPAPGPETTQFSAFAKNVFAAPANDTPVTLDGVTFTFDVDNDPMAFDGLLM